MIFKVRHLPFDSLPSAKQSNTFCIILCSQMSMDVSHSAYVNGTRLIFSKTEIIDRVDKTFASFQHGFLRSEKMLDFIILYT